MMCQNMEVNMNQTELAERSGYSRFGISLILTGKRDAGKEGAQRLVKVVEGTKLIDWLFAKRNHRRLAAAVRRAA
jgi:hypothetical protein